MAVKNSVQAIALTSIDSATFTGAYQAVNASGLAKNCFMIRITNNSNKDVTVSYNGTTDHDFIKAGTFIQLPFQEMAQPNNLIANMALGIIVYVKGAAGVGLVYLAGYYQPSLV